MCPRVQYVHKQLKLVLLSELFLLMMPLFFRKPCLRLKLPLTPSSLNKCNQWAGLNSFWHQVHASVTTAVDLVMLCSFLPHFLKSCFFLVQSICFLPIVSECTALIMFPAWILPWFPLFSIYSLKSLALHSLPFPEPQALVKLAYYSGVPSPISPFFFAAVILFAVMYPHLASLGTGRRSWRVSGK